MQEAIDCLQREEAFEGHKVDVYKVDDEASQYSIQVQDLPDDYETNF